MQFDSYIYAVFLPLVFAGYWLLRNKLLWQNMFLLAASYIFYGWWDWRFLGLIIITSTSTFLSGLVIKNDRSRRSKIWLSLNIILNLGILAAFKYFNFFKDSFADILRLFGANPDFPTINILLPVGISFYTLQAISYSFDVYNGKAKPTRNVIAFFIYISFFPQLVAGPIERARNLLPQFLKRKSFDYYNAVIGMRQILWGLVKKLVIADNLAGYVDSLLYHPSVMSASSIIMASILFAFQIYADFCGYSEMAIGVGRVMGFRITENFRRPYFATNVGDFWRRWHMSLMNWFRDYIYIPLGGSRCSKAKMYWNTMVVFMVSGLWHGANWTFIIWGAYHGALVCFYKLSRSVECGSKSGNRMKQSISKYGLILFVFVLVTIGWMVFRCDNFHQFFGMLGRFTAPGSLFFSWALTAILPIGIMLLKELKDEEGWNIHLLHSKNLYVQAISIAFLMIYVFYTGELNGAQFIYFQF